jgi:ribose transport system permease protein
VSNKSLTLERKKSTKFSEIMAKPEMLTILALAVLIIMMCFARPDTFPTATNFFNVIRGFSLTAILAVGMGLVIITGGIDLSVGSTIAFSSCLAAFVNISNGGIPPIFVLLIALAMGTGVGTANGLLVAKVGIPPFIATLGMLSLGKGFALLITNGSPIKYEPTWISVLGGGYIGPMPVSVVVTAAVVIVGFIFANNTLTGRNVFAVGNSIRAAKLSGIRVDRIVILVYAITGFLAGLCGLLLIGQMNSADPSFGSGYELSVIAAAVIGGISMTGGEGNILGTIAGAALMGVLKNMFVQLAVSGYWQTIILGFVIIGAVAIDSIRKKRVAR